MSDPCVRTKGMWQRMFWEQHKFWLRPLDYTLQYFDINHVIFVCFMLSLLRAHTAIHSLTVGVKIPFPVIMSHIYFRFLLILLVTLTWAVAMRYEVGLTWVLSCYGPPPLSRTCLSKTYPRFNSVLYSTLVLPLESPVHLHCHVFFCLGLGFIPSFWLFFNILFRVCNDGFGHSL